MYLFAVIKPLNRMIKITGSCAIALLITTAVMAQEDDTNIPIERATEEYRFEKGSKENPVLVKSNLMNAYLCIDFRTWLTVAEFYNN
jgi:hypothetical protein